MAKQRVLIQDIADSLHLSRTTVSKVLNGSSNVSQKNKERVLEKAAELIRNTSLGIGEIAGMV